MNKTVEVKKRRRRTRKRKKKRVWKDETTNILDLVWSGL